jgi:hypothetical protein
MCAICVIELMTDSFLHKNSSCEDLACKLTTPELALRKKTVLAALKNEALETRELEKGFEYKFNGSDSMIDRLCEFIKTERQCCDFFTFTLTIPKETSFIFLEITGPQGSKEFIKTELGL